MAIMEYKPLKDFYERKRRAYLRRQRERRAMAKTIRVQLPDSAIEEAAKAKIKELESRIRKLERELAAYKKLEEKKKAIETLYTKLRDVLDEVDLEFFG